jgi:hypothetical protein
MTYFFWPYPLLLCFQRWLGMGWLETVAADLAGLGVVGWFSMFAHRHLERWRTPMWLQGPVSLLAWYLPLAGVYSFFWLLLWPEGT